MAEVDITYLLPELRENMYDEVEPYTYTDSTLGSALVKSVKRLGRKWRHRYLVTSGAMVERNAGITSFETDEPPVIEYADESVIILQAEIIVKTARMFDSTWDVASWKDDEISYSNIQAAKSRDDSIRMAEDELDKLLKARLHPGKVHNLTGFHRSADEIKMDI